MNKRFIATVLLFSFLASSCSLKSLTENTKEEETTTTEETTEETSEETTTEEIQLVQGGAAPDADPMFIDLNAGDTFTFGTYDGEDIEWLVLNISGYTCYCITADNIDYMPLNETGVLRDFNITSICEWLNEDFYEGSFTDEEKVRIKYATGTESPVIDSENKIYLLNRFDAERYANILAEHPAHQDWWLRSKPYGTSTRADICNPDGTLHDTGELVETEQGIRPVMKLYIGTDEDTLDLVNLTPTPTPTPSPSPTPSPTPTPAPINYPEHDTVMPPLPDEVSYDASVSEEANLENYYTNNVQGLYGTAAAASVSTELQVIASPLEPWLDINGALAHQISDFDGDGDLEMVAFIFVAELDDEEIENSENYYYHLHLLLIDDVDGTIRVLDDLPVETRWTNPDGSMSNRFDEHHSGLYSNTYFSVEMGLYDIKRDGLDLILMTITDSANPIGDGFNEAAFIFEVSGEHIYYSSSYCACDGSDDTRACEVTYENGEMIAADWYYMYPDDYDAPGMYQGILLYLERHGLTGENREDNHGIDFSDADVTTIVRCGVDWESLEQQYYPPFLFTYYVES